MSRRITTAIILAIFLSSSLAVTYNPVKAATVLPPGFVSEVVVNNLTGPTTIAFTPDGRMFIGQKDGQVRVFQNGVLLPTDFINISAQVNNNWDRGLLGIAIHPDFPNTPYVYLLYTYDPPGVAADGGGARVSRLLRVTADPGNTNVALPGSEVVLLGTNSTLANIGNPANNALPAESCKTGGVYTGGVYIQDCIAADSPSHSIGTLTFGTDGSLFVSSGDGAHFNFTDPRALRALSIDSLNGKVLRIDPITGQGYADNPFYNGDPNSNRSKVYSLGLRNPFRVTINTFTNEPFIGDVGWGTWEELNTGRGKNFGWPCYEGNDVGSAQQTGYKNLAATSATCNALYAQGLGAVQAPIHSYDHTQGASAIQAGGFYRGIVYPAQYQGALFFSDYNADWIHYLTFDTNGVATKFDFGTDVSPVGGLVQLLIGPDTNLYYVAYNGPTPNTSEVRRIRYTSGGNTPPTANASADPDSGYVPLTVNFSSIGSFDPDVQILTYAWNFGDGATSTNPNPAHTYTTGGTFIATLTITDSQGATGSDTVSVTVGNLQPTATIITPTNGFAYSTGDIITYSGTGIDNEDGNLSGASLQWDILLHHSQHVHFDYIPGLTGNTGNFPIPDHGDNTWIELCLTVTDSGGLNDQECVNLQPNTVTLSFDTVPSGLELEYDGIAYTAPFSVTTNVNSVRDLIAPLAQEGCHNFTSWSDGGAASHQITTGATPQTYIATYTPCPVTVTVNPGQSKFYGDADPTFTYISSVPPATFTGALSRVSGENASIYAINQGDLAIVGNKYTIASFVPANFTINPKATSVTPNAASKVYGDNDPILTGILNGFLPADNVTATYSRIAGETVAGSPYTISATLNPTGVLGNYNITYNSANFTITIQPIQTITVTTPAPGAASDGSNFSVAATASSGLPVAITTSGVCTGSGDNTVTITMNSGSGICSIYYNQAGDSNYGPAAQVQEDVTATQKPSVTSANNTTFSFGLSSAFTITTTGNPATPMAITINGALPAGITFINNNDGTATLSGIPTTAGIYPLTITADNGVLPNAVQNFTLTVKNAPIIGANGINSVPDTGNGSISENESILDTLGITQLTVEFSQDVNDPADNTDPKDVTNPANYLLVLGSSTGVFQTISCSTGVVAPDIAISVDSVTYSNNNGVGPYIATLNINGGNPLNVAGFYRLYVCGTTSIVDAADTNLILAGNGTTPATDFLRNFRIQTRIANTGTGNNNSTARNLNVNGLLIPVTGFAPNQATPLSIQPADKAYKSLGQIRIEIPTLGINYPIVGAAINKNGWDLTWLKDSVAYLEGSAYPTLAGNTVLTAHVLDANNNLGPFSDIKGLQMGQKIYIHVNGQIYIYQIQENTKLLPSNISAVFKHEEYSWVTLVTCEDFNAKTALYTHRRMVRAVLVSVIPQK